MCGMKLVDRKTFKHLLTVLGFSGQVYRLVKPGGIHWYAHVLIRYDNCVLMNEDEVDLTTLMYSRYYL